MCETRWARKKSVGSENSDLGLKKTSTFSGHRFEFIEVVEVSGVEPLAYRMQIYRSTN